MNAARAFHYAQQIAEGLDIAHKQGVVHRDIKPQNILISSQDEVKIADFGLARGRDTVTLTQSNVFMGTAYYISPEQAESGRSADTRSDLYSVAIVLFEMLTGHPPFNGETAVDIVIKHMNAPVPSLSRIRNDLPPEADSFMQRALAKKPKDRYATPQEFIVALEQLQSRLPEGFRMPPADYEPLAGVVDQNTPPLTPSFPPPKEARLLVLSNGQSIPLTGELMVVGRQDPTMGNFPEITLMDKTVGRRHAYLRNKQGTITVEDLNALNKTRLNGVILPPHEEHTLNDGDILRFGTVEVRFESR
jgi:serine/threonine-protein kinase